MIGGDVCLNDVDKSESAGPGGDLVLELGDDLVEDGVLLVSLGLVLGVHLALVLEVGDGLLEGVFRLLEDGQGLGLLGEGGLDLLGVVHNGVTVWHLSA